MIHPTLALVATITGILLIWMLLLRETGAPAVKRSLMLLLGLAPPLMVTLIILGGTSRFGDLRVSMEGFVFKVEELTDGTVYAGGSKETDHLLVPGLPDGFLKIFKQGNNIVIALNEKAGDERFAMVRYRGKGGTPEPFHNAFHLEEGAQLSLGGKGEQATFQWETTQGQAKFLRRESDTTQECAPIPKRMQDIWGRTFEIQKNLSPHTQMFPLRYYGQTSQELKEGNTLEGANGEDLGSFMFWSGRLNLKPMVLLTDPGMVLQRGEKTHTYQNVVASLAPGQQGHINLYRIDYQHPGGQSFCRIQERRSFTIKHQNGVVDITLDTPAYVGLSQKDLKDLQRDSRQKPSPVLTLAQESYSRNASDDRIFLNFSIVGKPLDHELFSGIELNEKNLDVTTHVGRVAYSIGQAFQVGDKAAVKVRIHQLERPWGFMAMIWVAAMILALTKLDGVRTPMVVILQSFLELFLALRILVAFSASTIDTGALDGPISALSAYLVVPFVLSAAINKWYYRKPMKQTLIAGVLSVWAILVLYLCVPMTSKTLGFTLASVVLLPGLLTRVLYVLDRLPTWRPTSPALSLALIALITVALFVFRVFTLFAFGWKERIQLPVGVVAVSIYYTPACLWIFAMLWRHHVHKRWWGILLYGGLLTLTFGFVPVLAKDLGTALIFPIPVLLLFSLPCAGSLKSLKAMFMALPFLVYIAAQILLPFSSPFGFASSIAGWQSSDYDTALEEPSAAMSLIASRMDETHNRLRIWGQAAPDKLKEVGTTDSESLSMVMANLDTYATRGALGEGYLSVPLSGSLRATHLNDNVSAIHVIAAFGWLGSGALLVFLVAFGYAPLALARGEIDDISGREALGMLCCWTLLTAGLYMFSANINMLLLTGKNVYFLAATSLSDLVEGALLVLLAMWALVQVGSREVS